jgi:hypothetical protein
VNQRRTIFVSYARSDREFARSLVTALTERLPQNIHFVLDVDAVSPGENLIAGTAKILSNVDAMIVIVTEASASSSWVRSEVAWALAEKGGNLPIFPVLKGPQDAIPYLLRSRVYVDFSDNEKFIENINRLGTAILRALDSSRSVNIERPHLESVEGDFIDMQKSVLQELTSAELRRQRSLSQRLMVFIATLIVFMTTLVMAVLIINKQSVIGAVLSVILTPLTGLTGTVVGYYFGLPEKSMQGREV